MIFSLLSLVACFPKVIIKEKVVVVSPPDSLLVSPCSSVEAGSTVRTLAKGYVENTSCISKHKQSLQSIKDWKDKQNNQ